jgi:putative transposase
VLSRACGFSRQAYYQALHRQEKQCDLDERALKLVKKVRKKHPHMGTRKIYHEVGSGFRKLKLGRDRLFGLMRRERLLVVPKRRRCITTKSNHGQPVYENLLKEVVPQGPNEVFVADITYLETHQGFAYLAQVTDAFSRKVVGHDVSDSLSVEGSLRALKMALRQVSPRARRGLIHHSDQGVQYSSRAYVAELRRHGVRSSMASRGNPYENAIAERVNGILKNEYDLGMVFGTRAQARNATREAIRLYNEERPHLALGYLKPSQVHAGYRMAA